MRHKLLFGTYQFLIQLYGLAIRCATLWSPKARSWINGRKGPKDRPSKWKGKRPIWYHAASTGEFEQGRPIIEKLQEQEPHRPILLTFFSPSGYQAAQKYSDQFVIEYLPLDTYLKAGSFISKWNPTLAIFIKYEIWPSYLSVLHDKKIPTLVISSRWRPQQIYFRFGRRLFYPLLRQLDHIFVQDALSLEILKAEGLSQVTLSGDTRIDRVLDISQCNFDHPLISFIGANERVLLLGSSWPADEKKVFEALADSRAPVFDRIIIVPHELGQAHISALESEAPQPVSIIYKCSPKQNAKTIIVNEMGVLAYLYRLADIAYVGGGFGDGIHSILEAAVYGVPVLFGPRHHKFKEAEDLIELGSAETIETSDALLEALKRFSNPRIQNQVKRQNRNYFQEQAGASQKISRYIESRLNKKA
jgi:3-deoxy-D-manno-octulosonic-acid transferase